MAATRRERWERIGALVRAHRARLAVVGATSFVSGLVEAAFLVVVTQVALAVTQDEATVELAGRVDVARTSAIGVAAALIAVRALLALANVWSTTQLAMRVGVELRYRLAGAFLRASWATQQAEPAGRLQQLVGGFAGSAIGVLHAFTTSVTAGLSLAAMLAVAVAVSPVAMLGAMVVLLALGSVLAPLRRAIRTRAQIAAETNLRSSARITELGALGLEMQTYGVRDAFVAQTEAVIEEEALVERDASLFKSSVAPVYTTLGYLALVGGLGAATSLAGGNFAEVGAVMLVMLRSLGYGQAMQVSTSNLMSAVPFLEVVDETLERFEGDRAPGGDTSIAEIDAVEADHVSFSYDETTDVLRDLCFRIERGEHIGIVGPSGSGKSTLVQLLLGLREPSSGTLRIGGHDLAEIDRRTLAPLVAFVTQEPLLFAGSIAENIAFFRPEVSREQIEQAASSARLDADLARMPEGLDTNVGQRGTRLSGGQRQRVAIARALAGEPHLLVLDEPTSALDVHSEIAIRDTIAALRGRITVVIVAHRLSTLDACDRVMVLQSGEVLAFAPPKQLAEQSGFYRDALALSNVQ